ncbi:MAG: hypothetical protein CEE38_09870 [Planctomycetes bacterium B3_Pla]|nr:MAG: hypothetical protein CEE38_09870 [Planctomycetes bacterium B3_Pla]
MNARFVKERWFVRSLLLCGVLLILGAVMTKPAPAQEPASGFIDCLVECMENGEGLDDFWFCFFLCSLEFPDEATQIGPPPAILTESGSRDGFIEMEGCKDFLKNATGDPIRLLVTICNTSKASMNVDIGGKVVTVIEPGECQGIVVDIPPGEALHADEDGKWKAQSL